MVSYIDARTTQVWMLVDQSVKTIQINLIKFRQVHHNTALQYFFMMRAPITCLVKETLPKEQRTVEKFISILFPIFEA